MSEEKEISLGQIFGVVKKSLKLGLLYVLVGVIVSTAILFTVRAFTDTSYYSSEITVEKTDVNTINKLSANKSNVINKAVSDRVDAHTISKQLAENLFINAIVPENLEENGNFIPNSFTISLRTDKLKLTKAEYNDILDKVSMIFCKLFADKSLQKLSFTYPANEIDGQEYIKVAEELACITKDYLSVLGSVKFEETVNNFVSSNSGKSVNDIYNSLKSVLNSLEMIKLNVITNKLEKSSNGIKNYLDFVSVDLKTSKDSLEKQLTTLKDNITNYQIHYKVEIDPTTGIAFYTSNEDTYANLLEKCNELQKEAAEAEGTYNKCQSYITEIPASSPLSSDAYESAVTQTVNSFKQLYTTIQNSVSDYQELVEEYNAYNYDTVKASVVSPAHTQSDNLISLTVIIIFATAVAVIAYSVAFGKTFSKLKKQGYFD